MEVDLALSAGLVLAPPTHLHHLPRLIVHFPRFSGSLGGATPVRDGSWLRGREAPQAEGGGFDGPDRQSPDSCFWVTGFGWSPGEFNSSSSEIISSGVVTRAYLVALEKCIFQKQALATS